jgi:CHAT domain-containing protein/lipopolysaccharide biosynthesis regulator YciM
MLSLLLVACSAPTENPTRLFDAARADLQAGELARAEATAERGLAVSANQHDLLLEWKFRLLRSEILLSNGRAEVALAQLGDVMPQSPEYALLAARKLMLQGQASSILNRPAVATALLEEAHRAADAAKAEDLLLDIELIQGNRLQRSRQFDESESLLRRALARARALHSTFVEAGILVNLGRIRVQRNRFDEAAGYFEEASRLAGPQSRNLYSVAQSNLATCFAKLGEYDQAVQIHLASIARHEQSGAKYFLPGALAEAGHAYLEKGDIQAAIPYLQRALSLSNELKRTSAAAVGAGNLANVYVELGDWDKAAALNDEAVRLKTTGGIHTLFYNVLNSARIAAGRGDDITAALQYNQAMEAGKSDPVVGWEAQEGLGALALRQHQPAEAARHFEAAVSMVERTRADFSRTEFKLPFLTRLIRLYRQYVDTLVEQREFERALAVADSSRAQVLAERSGSAPAGRLQPQAYRALARQTGSILLSYWLGPAHSYVWVVDPRNVYCIPLPPVSEIEPLVREYQNAIERRLADPLRTRIPAGERLYQLLIAPINRWIPASSRVVATLDGPLNGLNLEALPVPSLQSGGAPRYWIENVTVSIAPSLALLAERAQRTAPERGVRRLLLLGDPVASDSSFPPLADAAGEIEGVKRSFGIGDQVVLARDRATPQAYLAASPAGFSAIHFTAHAVANRESPLDSAVLLSGGKLYAREVMDVPLTADLVTVSACRGAGVRTYSGEGLVGFAWAFLHAGARHVIAGLWDVNDQSTAVLMKELYRELAAGKSPEAALRDAKLSLIASTGNLRKPYYWAPFQLYTVEP